MRSWLALCLAFVLFLVWLSSPRSVSTVVGQPALDSTSDPPDPEEKQPSATATPQATETSGVGEKDEPKTSGHETPHSPSAAFLSTSEFTTLTTAIDFSNEASIRDFEKRLKTSKGLLSFPEYCYLQGRVDFARQDFPSAVRLFRQITDVQGFIDLHYDTFYYLGAALAHTPADREKAIAALEEYLRISSTNDQLSALAKDTLAQVRSAKPTRPVPAHKELQELPQEASKSHVFQAEPDKAVSGSRVSSPAAASDAGISLHLEKETVMLDELGERLLLLHFWASWCVPCAKELPLFVAFSNERSFQKQGHMKATFVTIDNFLGEGTNFLKSAKLKVNKLYWDPNMLVLRHLTGGVVIPTTVLYDSERRRVIKVFPQTDWRSPKIRTEVLGLASKYLKSNQVDAKGEKH